MIPPPYSLSLAPLAHPPKDPFRPGLRVTSSKLETDAAPSAPRPTRQGPGLAIDIDPFELGNDHFGTRFDDGWSFGDTRVTRPQVEARMTTH
jgi:hypothetical protein